MFCIVISQYLIENFLQDEADEDFRNIVSSVANGFYGFIGSPFRRSKFLFRAMEHFAAHVRLIYHHFKLNINVNN